MKSRKLLLLLLPLMMFPLLAWWGRPCPCWGGPFRGPPMARSPSPYPSRYPGNYTIPPYQGTPSGYPIGGPFCAQCHATPPTVDYVYPVRQATTVKGIVVKSAPTIVVLVNGNNIYHVRFPYYCPLPKVESNVTLSVFVTIGARTGNLNWYMGMIAQGCP